MNKIQYKPYPQYKPSGIEWIGEIPEGWEVRKLQHLFDIKAGGDLKNEFYSDEKTELYKYPIYTNSIKSEQVYGYTSKPIFQANTITVTGRGEIGYAIYRDHMYDAIIRLLVLIPRNHGPCKFYEYYINGTPKLFGGNTAVGQLSTEQIKPYMVLLPPLPEQQAIAAFLDREVERINSIIAKQTRMIALLKEKRSALITQVVTKGLDPKAKMKDSGVEWIGEIPEGWENRIFKRVITKIKDGTHGSFERTLQGKTLLSAKNVSFTGIQIEDNESLISDEDYLSITKNGFPKKGDLLLTIVGTIGRAYVYDKDYPLAFQRSVAFLRLKPNALARYYYYSIQAQPITDQFYNNAKVSAQSGLYMSDVSRLDIVIPPLPEQQAIVDFLDHETVKIDTLIGKIEKQIELLNEYKQSLITHAVTGKIDVRG